MFPNSFSFFPFPYNKLDEQTEGIDTFRSHQHGPEFEDDGGISSDEAEAMKAILALIADKFGEGQ